MILQTISGLKTIEEVLPDAFGPRDLAEGFGQEKRN
jgi:cytidine deaminase